MKIYNFAIIGCGAIADIHAKAISEIPNAKICGVFDIHRESASRFACKYGTKIFSTIEELCGCQDVDIVNVCTPSGLHAEILIKLANANKNIVVEKPMAITKKQLDDVIFAVEKNKVKVAVITQLRFTPAVQKLKSAIQEGRLGQILMADYNMKYYRSPEYYSAGGWRGTWEMDGGGALMNQGIHGIDLIQYLLGGIKSVYATCRTMARAIETEDVAYLMVEYNNGALGYIHCTTLAEPGYPRRIEITGTKGTVVLEEDVIKTWDVQGENVESGTTACNSASNPMMISYGYHKMQFEDLIRAIETDMKPLVDVYEGRKPVDIILAAYSSSKTGKKVQI